MYEYDILETINKAVAKARYGAYALLDVNETLGERLEEKLRDASKMIEARRRAIVRLEARREEQEKRLSA